jgi:signal transduction histidine kinase/CheY-like chemotaxis protein/PAS domain-containing protein
MEVRRTGTGCRKAGERGTRMENQGYDREICSQILQRIPSGVGVYDVTDNTVRKIYLNEGYYQMIGADREKRHDYDGTRTVNAIHPDEQSGVVSEARAAIAENRLFSYRFRVLDGSGNYQWIAIRANHEAVDEHTERFYASYYNVDELVRIQEKLRGDEILFNDAFKYSDILHFTYYPQKHSYEVMVVPENLKSMPKTMADYPESYIRYTGMSEAHGELYRDMIRAIDAGDQEAECTVQICYPGKPVWIRVHLWNFLDDQGRPIKAIGNVVDITPYKQAEIRYQEEKLRMKSLQSGLLAASRFNVTSDFSIELNNDANLSYSDPKMQSVYKEAVAVEPEIAHQSPATLKVLLSAAEQIPDAKQRRNFLLNCSHIGMMRLYEAGKREYTMEYRRWTGRGLIWVSTRIAMMPDPETGDILAFYYTQDINNRMIYRQITSRIIEKNHETVSYYDCNVKKLYLKTESAPTDIIFDGVPYEDAVREAVEFFVSPLEAEKTRRAYALENVMAGLEKEAVYSIYYTGRERDDTLPGKPYKRMKSDFFYLDDNRDTIAIIQTNVTAIYEQERETREKMARAMEAARSANNAKTEFLSRISHDIRTPISIISSMTDFALEDMGDEAKLRDDLMKIKSADTFLLSLISDVLDISKIDSGKITLDPQPYTYEEHTRNIRNVLEPMCAEKGIRCEITRRNKTGVIVVDQVRLNQITLNLISNAVKYTPPGGSVTYSSISEDLPDARIRFGFELRDTGIGMSPEFQKVMFDAFSQEYDNPGRPKGITGTGLGLSIVKKMVDLMGGTLEVESTLGKGTMIRLIIDLPDALRDPRYCSGQAAADLEEDGTEDLKGRVLLAEDNAINTEIALRVLRSFGLTVDCVENGAEAVRRFETSPAGSYDAILMDIQMPVMDGYTATKRIRASKQAGAATIPIIAMTADAFSDAAQRGREAGMNDYLVKPLDPPKLRAILKRACDSNKNYSK